MHHLISSVKPFYEVVTLTIFIFKMKESNHIHLREMLKVCDCRSWLRILTGESFLVFHFFSVALPGWRRGMDLNELESFDW